MKKVFIMIIVVLNVCLCGCSTKKKPSDIIVKEEIKLSELCQAWGNPDYVQSAANFGARFISGYPHVVLTYTKQKRHVYLSREGLVLGLVPIKDGWSPPKRFEEKPNTDDGMDYQDPFKSNTQP